MGSRGPQPKTINWDEVSKLISYQCTQAEVAAFFDISVDWLDELCQRANGEKLSAFWSKRRALGRVKLRKIQFDNIEKAAPGWAAVAIWLDKKLFPDENPEIIREPTRDVQAIGSGIKTFGEFCHASDYFIPFPKQEEMRAFGFDSSETRLLLGARGYGKTEFVTIMGTAYHIYYAHKSGFDMSEFTVLIITKSKSRNSAITEEIGTALIKNGVPLDKNNSSVIRVAGLIGQDHSVEAITIKTSMRGRHPKKIIMDDPVTDEDVSEKMRKTVKRKYDEAYKLCKNMLIIGQPAHFDDLYANLRDIITTMLVPHGTIPELDADLTAMKLAGVDDTSIEMSYHLRVPESGSAIFSNLNFIDTFPVGDSVAFIDPSDGGDYTAMSVFRGYFSGIAVKGRVWKKAWYHCIDEIVAECKARGVRRLCFETNKHGEQPLDQLKAAFKLAELQVGVVGSYSDSNKHLIIEVAGSYAHQIYLSKDSDTTYTNQVKKYEYGSEFDDAPDSLARGLEWLKLIKGKAEKKT
jgi:hypothetical protein